MTAQQAKDLMLAWANGELSHWSSFALQPVLDNGDSRNIALAECARADAAEVEKWSAVYRALREAETA